MDKKIIINVLNTMEARMTTKVWKFSYHNYSIHRLVAPESNVFATTRKFDIER